MTRAGARRTDPVHGEHDDEHEEQAERPAPPDLRLVPAALATWAAVLAGLLGGIAGGITAAVLAALALPVALLRARASARAAAPSSIVLAAAGCALVAAVLVTVHAAALASHPLRAPADRGAAAEVRVRLTDDPRLLRSTTGGGDESGAARAMALVPTELVTATVGGDRVTTGGKLLLLAPAASWTGLLPGQEVSAAGLLMPAQRPDLTVAVLKVRGAPQDVTAPPWWQTGAGALRDGLRDAAVSALPEAPAGLLPGLAIGDTRAQLAETEQDFRTAGLAHLTAVSGDTAYITHVSAAASTPVRALIYTRVSQDRLQRGRSVSEQEAECRETCEENGWTIVGVLTDNDRGASRWSTKDRPAYRELTRRLESGEVDVIVMWESSRGQRDLAEFAAFRDLCWERNVLWSYGGRTYDLSRTSDRRAAGGDALDAETEASKTRDRIMRTTRRRAQAGEPHGKLPYGYVRRYDPHTGELIGQELDPETAPVVAEMARRALAGESLRGIARDLTSRGIVSPDGHRMHRRGIQGPPRRGWEPEQVKRILVSPTHAGLREYQGQIVGPATWPAIIGREDRERLLSMLCDPRRKSWTDNVARHLMVGLARCGVCGGSIRLMRNRTYLAYACGANFCVARKQEWVDELIGEVMIAWLGRPDVRNLLTEDDPAAGQALDEARALRARWTELVDLLKAGKISAMAFAEAEPPLLASIESAERRARPEAIPDIVLDSVGDGARELWGTMPVSKRRQLVRALMLVTIHTTPRGRKFDPTSVEIRWKY